MEYFFFLLIVILKISMGNFSFYNMAMFLIFAIHGMILSSILTFAHLLARDDFFSRISKFSQLLAIISYFSGFFLFVLLISESINGNYMILGVIRANEVLGIFIPIMIIAKNVAEYECFEFNSYENFN